MTVATKFYEVLALPEGTEVEEIIGGAPSNTSGYIKQILIASMSGGGTHINIQIRYFPGDGMLTNLVYLYENAELPEYAGINVDAPFDLKSKDTPNDLVLYLQPELEGLFKVRIDFEFDSR